MHYFLRSLLGAFLRNPGASYSIRVVQFPARRLSLMRFGTYGPRSRTAIQLSSWRTGDPSTARPPVPQNSGPENKAGCSAQDNSSRGANGRSFDCTQDDSHEGCCLPKFGQEKREPFGKLRADSGGPERFIFVRTAEPSARSGQALEH
jgi:hypothetical protein